MFIYLKEILDLVSLKEGLCRGRSTPWIHVSVRKAVLCTDTPRPLHPRPIVAIKGEAELASKRERAKKNEKDEAKDRERDSPLYN